MTQQQVIAYLPVLSPVLTLLVVVLGVFFQNRHVDIRISDSTRVTEAQSDRIIAELTMEIRRVEAERKLEIFRLDNRFVRSKTRVA